MGGPSHDLQMFSLFLKEQDVPQQLALLCLDAREVNIFFFQNCGPNLILKSVTVVISLLQPQT